MDTSLRRAFREGDPIARVILADRAGTPITDGQVWGDALDRLLALTSPEVDVSTAEYVAAVIEAEHGAYPCFCSTMADGNCPTHGDEVADGATRGARFAAWLRADAVEDDGLSTTEAALSMAADTVARVVRRLSNDL